MINRTYMMRNGALVPPQPQSVPPKAECQDFDCVERSRKVEEQNEFERDLFNRARSVLNQSNKVLHAAVRVDNTCGPPSLNLFEWIACKLGRREVDIGIDHAPERGRILFEGQGNIERANMQYRPDSFSVRAGAFPTGVHSAEISKRDDEGTLTYRDTENESSLKLTKPEWYLKRMPTPPGGKACFSRFHRMYDKLNHYQLKHDKARDLLHFEWSLKPE